MSTSISGNFAIHRTKTINGKDAILIVPEDDIPLFYETGNHFLPVSFEHVEGGETPPDTYLTITYPNGDKTHLGPDIVLSRTKN